MYDRKDFITTLYGGVRNKKYRIICDICRLKGGYGSVQSEKLNYCKLCQYKRLSNLFSKPKKIGHCNTCGKMLNPRNKSQWNRSKNRFCSKRCLGIHRRKPIEKVKRSQIKKKILQSGRDPRCIECGHNHLWNLEAHHKKEASKGGLNSLKNLILLCRNCHNDKHSGLSRRKPCHR